MAAGNVLLNIMLVWILPANGFGIAAASLVGQALGAGDIDDAKAWAWQVVRIAVLVVGILALPALFFPNLILAVFLHDPHTLALAQTPLRLIAVLMTVESMSIVLLNAHYGAGHSQRVMAITLPFQWGLLLPTAYVYWADSRTRLSRSLDTVRDVSAGSGRGLCLELGER